MKFPETLRLNLMLDNTLPETNMADWKDAILQGK